jgi:PKD repeat protein
VARVARTLLLALVGGALLMVAFTARQATQGDVSAAQACGLGKPQTMLANKIPALFYPSEQNNPQNVQGVFPLDYAVNTKIAFTEDLSRAPGSPSNSIFTWRWSFGDGAAYVYQASPTHTFTKPGTYNVTSWVYIDGSWADDDPFDSSQIHIAASIPPNPPVAKVTSSLPVTALSQLVSFSADGSHSTDGSQLKYSWNFNDSGEASGPTATHKFITVAGGATFVALVVTDARGAQSLATVNITIQPQQNPPTASLSASDLEVDVGSTVSFDASQSAVPSDVPGDTLTKYLWNFGDGSASQTTETATTAHKYAKAGSYAVTMTVYDKNQTQASATVHVKVLGAASGGPSPLVIIGGIALLIGLGIGGYAFWQQRRRAEMVRRYQEAQALARARRGQGQRGPRGPNSGYGNSGYYGNGRQPAMRGGPPQRYDRPSGSSQPGQSGQGQRRPPAPPGGRPPRQSGRDEW